MSLTIGEKLRQAREERGISINEVAEQTRISPHYLESIETDDYRTLPGGIFNKGFVKSYAKYVGLDENEALQDYATLISAQTGDASDEPKTYRPEVLTDDRTSSSALPTIIFAVVILGLMTWGILTLVNYIQNNPSVLGSSNANQANANAAPANAANGAPAGANVSAAPAAIATDEIKFEFKSVRDTINVTYWTDGKMVSRDLRPEETLSVNPQQSLKIAYYRGFTPDRVQLTLNGKQVAAPEPPAKGNTVFEINKSNVAQILQSGQITADAAPAAAPR